LTAVRNINGGNFLKERKFAVCRELFLTFAKIGLFTFGGGYAMIALITSTCVERRSG